LRVTLRRLDLAAEIYHLREPQKIPQVMSPDETRRLLAVANILKVRILLSLAYGCGLRAGQVVRLKVKQRKSAPRLVGVCSAMWPRQETTRLPQAGTSPGQTSRKIALRDRDGLRSSNFRRGNCQRLYCERSKMVGRAGGGRGTGIQRSPLVGEFSGFIKRKSAPWPVGVCSAMAQTTAPVVKAPSQPSAPEDRMQPQRPLACLFTASGFWRRCGNTRRRRWDGYHGGRVYRGICRLAGAAQRLRRIQVFT
jgi:hypothetical protein